MIPRLSDRVRILFAALAFSLCASCNAVGEPSLDVRIGFDGRTVPGQFAPCVVSVSGLAEPVDATLVVEQRVGTAWKGASIARRDLASGRIAGGDVVAPLPIYDPLNPVRFTLVDSTGALLADTEVDLREGRRTEPFPVVCASGAFVPEPGSAATTPADLPIHWWAYEAVSRLWLAAPVSTPAREAIAEWVLAGGVLILFSGADFYHVDSALTRELMPIADPHVIQDSDGTHRLTGRLKASSDVLLRRADEPLAVARPYGAGHVVLVTVSAPALTATESSALLAHLRTASIVSLSDLTDDLLAQTPVGGPSHLMLTVLIVAAVGGLWLLLRRARRGDRPAIGWATVLFVALAVWSGFLSNRANQRATFHSFITSLHVETSFGIDAIFHSFASLIATEHTVPDARPGITARTIPVDPEGRSYASLASDGSLRLTVEPIDIRSLRSYGTSTLPVRFAASHDRVEIENDGVDIGTGLALFVRDGRIYLLPRIPTGTLAVALEEGQAIEAYDGEHRALLLALDERFPLQEHVLLLTIDVQEDVFEWPQGREKVRHLSVRLIEGGIS